MQPSTSGLSPTAALPMHPVTGGQAAQSPREQNGAADEQMHDTVRSNFVASPGLGCPTPSFSYNVVPQMNAVSGSPQPSQSINKLRPPENAASLQPPVPAHSAIPGPLFSYSARSDAGMASASSQQNQSAPVTGSSNNHSGKFIPSKPPIPGQLCAFQNSSSNDPGRESSSSVSKHPLLSPSKGHLSTSTDFSFPGRSLIPPSSGGSESNQSSIANNGTSISVVQESRAETSASSGVQPAKTFTSSATSMSSPSPGAVGMPSPSLFNRPAIMPSNPRTPGPPGVSVPSSSFSGAGHSIGAEFVSVSAMTTASSNFPGHSNPVVVPIQPIQRPLYPSFPVPPVVQAPPPLWLHNPQVPGQQRPFVPYQGLFPSPFGMPVRPVSFTAVVSLEPSQPPGVSPAGPSGGTLSVAGSVQTSSESEPQSPPPGTAADLEKKIPKSPEKDNESIKINDIDAWTSHKTETGVVYYYNAITGISTYDRPSLFKEVEKATSQPTPVSCEKLEGTDWALVTTNDGKKYYYHTKDKVSSWQVPLEVSELRKKQEGDLISKAAEPCLQHHATLAETAAVSVSLSTPAIDTGGRDAMSLRASPAAAYSSALDLIKKKLQDAGTNAASSPLSTSSVPAMSDVNNAGTSVTYEKDIQTNHTKDKFKDSNGDGNLSESSSDSDDGDTAPSKEECIIQFREMLKEKGVAPFSKWDKELPKFIFDPRFKAISGHELRRSLFEHYVRTRAEEERKEKRAAQKAATEGFRKLLEEASEEIDYKTDYEKFKRKWGHDPRFEAVERKEREQLLNERVLSLKRALEEKNQAERAAAVSSFISLLREHTDINTTTRWSRVKDDLRSDPRYRTVRHEDREILFNEYISEIKAKEQEAELAEKAKRDEKEKLKEREREMRKRKEREEQEMERVRVKARRKDAAVSYQALLTEKIKDPNASWTDSRPKLDKDPLERAKNPDLEEGDMEKFFREHVKMLYERCAREFKVLLSEVLGKEAADQASEDGKSALNSWSVAKRLLKHDARYEKMPRKDRETLWQKFTLEMNRKQKASDSKSEKNLDDRARTASPGHRSRNRR